MKIQLLSLICVLMFFSCQGGRNAGTEAELAVPAEESDFFVFDFESSFQNEPKTATLNELADSIRYLPLETNDNILLYNNNRLAKIGGDIFIRANTLSPNDTYPIYQFDSLGRFVKQVTHLGRGPNEIVVTWTWYVNPKIKQLNVVDAAAKMLIVQTESGEKSTVGINLRQGYDRVPLSDSTFVSVQPLHYQEIPNTYLYFIDRNGNLIHAIERNDELLSYNTNTSEYGQAPPYETYRLWPDYKGDAIFHDIFNDTLYRIKSRSEITPHLVFKRGAMSPRPEDKQKPENKKKQVYFMQMMESGDYVFLNYFYEDNVWRDIWHKRDGSLAMRFLLPNFSSASDFYIPFELPDGRTINLRVIYADRDNIYCILRAFDACKFLPDVKEDDNPVIVVAKLK